MVAEGDGCGSAFALAVPVGAANCACGCRSRSDRILPQTIISLPVQTAVVVVSGARRIASCWWLSNCPCWDRISRRCLDGRRCFRRPRRSFRCLPTLPCDSVGQRARWWCWSLSNYLCWDCICRRCSNRPCHFRPRRSFHCRSTLPCDGLGQSGALVVLVGVQLSVRGIVSAASVQQVDHQKKSRPKRSFHCRSRLLCDHAEQGSVVGAGGRPAICGGIISSAGVQIGHVRVPPQTIISVPVQLLCDTVGRRARR